MEYVIGALLLASFFGLAVYAVRGGNLMIGMLIIGTLWTVLPLFGNTFATNPDFIAAYPGVTDISFVDAITKVYQSGPEGWGSVLVIVLSTLFFLSLAALAGAAAGRFLPGAALAVLNGAVGAALLAFGARGVLRGLRDKTGGGKS